jgi:uncharacterized membrane protein
VTLWDTIRNVYGHFHPALVHFPIALVTTGAALEIWDAVVRRQTRPSRTAELLLILGLLGALLAAGSGLALFHAEDFRPDVRAAAETHRVLALAGVAVLLAAVLWGRRLHHHETPGSGLIWTYRTLVWLAAVLVGLAGHYGGWMVFGWGRIWSP